MTKPWLVLSIVFGLVLVLAPPAWPDFQAGKDAYDRGDYDTALKEWRPLAEQGDADAQHQLGNLYRQGKSVPQDYAEAMKWTRLAAEQGYAWAQYNLGIMYDKGQGVPQDYIQAYMWASLAAAPGDEDAVEGLEVLGKKMSPDQIAQAQRLAREWKPKSAK